MQKESVKRTRYKDTGGDGWRGKQKVDYLKERNKYE